jgi:hypothetical protein
MTTAGAITLSYSSGSGGSSVVCTGSPTVNSGDTVANGGVDYTTVANGIEDAAGNDLASFTNKDVTNNSTQGTSYCTQRATDLFNRSNSTDIGASWVEANGELSIASNTLSAGATSSVGIHATALSTATQYVKFKVVGGTVNHAIYIRCDATDGDPTYTIWATASGTEWNDTDSLVQSTAALTWAAGDVFAVLIKGTGTSTVVSIWKSPTNDVPLSGGTHCTDTAKPCWDSAGDAPDLQFDNNPSPASDSDVGHGILMYNASSTLDDYFAGDCSD